MRRLRSEAVGVARRLRFARRALWGARARGRRGVAVPSRSSVFRSGSLATGIPVLSGEQPAASAFFGARGVHLFQSRRRDALRRSGYPLSQEHTDPLSSSDDLSRFSISEPENALPRVGLDDVPELKESLTDRKREVAELAARGMRNSEIAETLHISENTVKHHLKNAFQKMNIDRRSHLIEMLR